MIIVKIELHSARTGKITPLGQMHLSNTGDTTAANPKRGDYNVELFRKGSTTKVQRKALVRDYPRQSYTVWELVRRSLEAALGKWPIHPGHPSEFDEDVRAYYEGTEDEQTIKSDKNSPDWLNRFRTYIYQNHRSVALEAEEQLLSEDKCLSTEQVSFGATKPSQDGFTVGAEIEPGVVSDEFKQKLTQLGAKHWDTPRPCNSCGKPSRPSTAGCDHCDLEDK